MEINQSGTNQTINGYMLMLLNDYLLKHKYISEDEKKLMDNQIMRKYKDKTINN